MNPMRKILVLALFALALSPLQKPDQPAALTGDGGAPIGGSFLIDNQDTDLSHPSAAYNSSTNEYLVVYQANSNQTIMSARISGYGQVLGYEPVVFHGSQVLQNPDVAYNPAIGKFLVVWEYDDGSYNRIYGRIFQPGGSSGAEFSLGTGTALRNRYKPAVAYASTADKFLVVWESVVWQSGTSDVEAQVLSSSGALEGSNFLVAQGDNAFAYSEPDVAYNRSRNEHLVVWAQEEKSIAQLDIFGRRVTAAGVIVDVTAITIGYHTANETSPAVAALPTASDGLYAVAWELHYAASDHDIYERMVTGLGTANPVGVVANTTGTETHPSIAINEPGNYFLVNWSAPYPAPFVNIGIYGRSLSSSGGLIGQERLVGGLFGDYPAATSGSSGDFLIAFQDPNLLFPVTLDIWGGLWGYRQFMPAIYR